MSASKTPLTTAWDLELLEEAGIEDLTPKGGPFTSPADLARAQELVRSLAVAHTNAGLYPLTHPALTKALDDVVDATKNVLAVGMDCVTVNVYKETLFVENQVFTEESVTYRRLLDELLAHGVSAATFHPGLRAQDVSTFMDVLLETRISGVESAMAFLAEHGVSAITLAETSAFDADEDCRSKQRKESARSNYDAGIESLRDVEMASKLGRAFDIAPLQRVLAAMLDELLSDPAAVLGLTAIKSHDDYSLNHAINVCILSVSLGSALGLEGEELRSLGLSALLYDLGKVRIPESILGKEGPLTSEEWEIMKAHPVEGADLLKQVQLLDPMPMVVAYEHHQRYDLHGYPQAADGQEQHLYSKIVAVADAYDAMTTCRPFRREIRPDKALAALIQGRSNAYDPEVVNVFVSLLGIYPMGAVVLLDDGSAAVVFRVNDDLLHPRVKVLVDAEGRWLEKPEVIDLRSASERTVGQGRCIAECVIGTDVGIDDVWQYL